MLSTFSFDLPQDLIAREPAERRGINRDQVRLMVIDRATNSIQHTRFDRIAEWLRQDDLLVLNSSRTIPASLQGHNSCIADSIEVRLSEHLSDDSWLALILCENINPFGCKLRTGIQINFLGGLSATLIDQATNIPRLWRLQFSLTGNELFDLLYRIGRPVRYEYVSSPWTLENYQTIYAKEPGSAEMPSAGRAFTWKVLLDLKRRGIETAFVTLHAGLSSFMDDDLDLQHPFSEEEYEIGERAADQIENTRSHGGRIIAVGTTVVKALESVANQFGKLTAHHDYTRLHISAETPLRIVDGLLTGLHEPYASHLDLLSAFLPPVLLHEAYNEAISKKYLWHEFGDLNLIL